MKLRTVLLDLGGVFYEGTRLLPGAQHALARLRASGLALRFVTNTTRQSRAALLLELARLGLDVATDELLTPASAARTVLLERGLRPLLLIHPGLTPDFDGLDLHQPNAVVVGDAGDHFSYAGLNQAFRLLMAGAPLLALGRNRYFKEADGLSLDAGPFVAALEYAAGVSAELLGKPAPALFAAALRPLGCSPDEAVMIGDDVEADVNGALAAGLGGILVRTGKYRPADDMRLAAGGRLADDIGAAVETLCLDQGKRFTS
ncbi:TIGR01458 family HAD-type hydrolase [Immundisolibacter sp.]|jgi:HAD superfamily hydrolase (TIGR01458 family)|uniref:TIGR01458 family HAD-type hydrolase n=1 Tax=Immundisolibacter sp. TaxID=1934948 RepID=UPI002B16FFBF|nr:TIGR01458 family HAD-type hydrolase [Immundisolibacter sp.]MEA3221142.1 Dihydroxyacetone phosphatase [Immundisolibacter sp.]